MDKNKLLEALKPEADKVNQAMRKDLASLDSTELSDVLHHAIFNGGKRIRPLLTIFSAGLLPGAAMHAHQSSAKGLYQLAMVFEYLHAASLLHDDVIDKAEVRRGKPAANRKWGVSPVILAGDFLHARAMMLAGTIGGTESVDLLGKAITAMIEAEFLQKKNAEERDRSEKRYFAVLQGKTAALISSACEVGMLYNGGSVKERKAVAAYGANLGHAFQVIDDLLDYLGDPEKTGKSVGNDFVEGKMTLPLIRALNQATKKEKNKILRLLSKESQDRTTYIDDAREFINKYDGFAYSKSLAQGLITYACRELDIFPTSPIKDILIGLANYVLTRKK